jgi:hypothetical protein
MRMYKLVDPLAPLSNLNPSLAYHSYNLSFFGQALHNEKNLSL